MTLVSDIPARAGRPARIMCDRRCEKAWGVNGRRNSAAIVEYDPADADDVAYLADHETGEAPRDPGTYECGEGKPMHPERHNKWCLRECERSVVLEKGKEGRLPDFSRRVHNQPWKHIGER